MSKNAFVVEPWVLEHDEWTRDFKRASDGFAAHVYLSTNCDPEAKPGDWFWSASRHEKDDRDKGPEEEWEWIKCGEASSAEEGRRLADKVLRAVGYVIS